MGGQTLLISGYGFATRKEYLQVLIDGEECGIQSVSKSLINCTTAVKAQTTDGNIYHPGGHGLTYKIYINTHDYYLDTFINTYKITKDAYSSKQITLEPYAWSITPIRVERFEGLFKPIVNGKYKFRTSASSEAIVFMNLSGRDKNQKERILHLQTPSSYKTTFTPQNNRYPNNMNLIKILIIILKFFIELLEIISSKLA